ncbi:hypothetical protein FA15DRAFT_586232, partial [Coprinopsis marcescibilis]
PSMSTVSNLITWSKQHIPQVFGGTSYESSLLAIQDTFSRSIKLSINGGTTLSYDQVRRQILDLRASAYDPTQGLKATWKEIAEAEPEQGPIFADARDTDKVS